MEWGTSYYFYYDDSSNRHKYQTVISLLQNQWVLSLTGHEGQVNQQKASYETYCHSFMPHMQLTAVQGYSLATFWMGLTAD